MTYTPPPHTPFGWQDAPSTATPLDAANLEAAETDLVTYTQTATESLLTYLNSNLTHAVVPSNLQLSGHSYMDPGGTGIHNGSGIRPNPYSTGSRIAALLGVQPWQVNNLAVSGAVLRSHKNNGAARYLQLINPGNSVLWPVIPKTGVHFGWWGTNDMILGAGGLVQKGFMNGYRSLISRYRASAVWDYNDATVSKTGTWTEVTWASQNLPWGSGAGAWGTSEINAQITIAIPSAITQDGQTRTVALGFVMSANGGTFTIRKDGVLQGTFATGGNNWDNTEYGAGVYRLPVSPGDANITITLTSIDGGHSAYFNYWQVESSPAPLFLMGEVTLPPSPPSLWNGVNPAHVDAFNGYLATLVTEFDDPSVAVVPLDTALGGATIRANGQFSYVPANYIYYEHVPTGSLSAPYISLHPNDLGAQVAAEQVIETYRNTLLFNGLNPRQVAGYATSERYPATDISTLQYSGDGPPLQLLDAFDVPDQDTTPAGWTMLSGGWGIRNKQLAILHDVVPPFPYTDSFQRANSATVPGPDWTVVHGTWGIQSDELKCFTSVTPQGIVLNNQQLDINGDGGIEFTVGSVNDDFAGVLFRYQDDLNYWLVGESVTFGGWGIYKVTGGVATAPGTTLNTHAAGTVVNLELHGTSITVHINGKPSMSVTDSYLQTQRTVGVAGFKGSSSVGPTFDSFSVRPGPITLVDVAHINCNVIVRDLGVPDITYQWTQGADSPIDWAGAIFRYVDANNFLYLYESESFGAWGFQSVIGGTAATVADFFNFPAPGDVMQVALSGNQATIRRNGVNLGASPYTITSCPQGTFAGFAYPNRQALITTAFPLQVFDNAWSGNGAVQVPDHAYYRDNVTGIEYGPYVNGTYSGTIDWLPENGARTIEINSTGLSSAQIDALFHGTPINGTVVSDPTNKLVLTRQAGKWYKTAALTLIS